MIIDSHLHMFPPMGGASGHRSRKEHMQFVQREISLHHLPVLRATDSEEVNLEQSLLDGNGYAVDNLTDVSFRGGEFGRLTWTHQGTDYYKQFLPPHATDLSAPVDLMVAQMNHAGIDKAVLHTGHTYGRLNKFLSSAVQKFSDRLWAMALVDEWKAHEQSQIDELDHAIDGLGLSGLWFDTRNIYFKGGPYGIDHPANTPFFNHVRDRNIPIYWNCPSPEPTRESYMETLLTLGRWLDRYPEIPCVLTNGFPFDYFKSPRGIVFPEDFWQVLDAPNLLVEICFPIITGGRMAYPYEELWPIIDQFYQRLGPTKLVWGSDMPNVERFCTYRQCLDYLRLNCDFIPQAEMNLICGDNVAKLFSNL